MGAHRLTQQCGGIARRYAGTLQTNINLHHDGNHNSGRLCGAG